MWRPILKLILNLHVSHPELPTNPVTKASTYSSFYISIGIGYLCILSLTDVTSRTYDILILFFTCPPNSMGSCHYHPDDYHMFRSCPFLCHVLLLLGRFLLLTVNVSAGCCHIQLNLPVVICTCGDAQSSNLSTVQLRWGYLVVGLGRLRE